MTTLLHTTLNNRPLIYKNDYGTLFLFTIYDQDENIVDVTFTTSITFNFKKPDGTIVPKTGSVYGSGSEGKVQYVIEENLMDMIGLWNCSVSISFSGGKWDTNIIDFQVYESLS